MKFRLINAMVLSAALSGNVWADLNDGLVAYYPFNGNAQDESGNGNDGTVNGATLTEDRFGNKESAYSFDGKDDYIANLNPSGLNFSKTNEVTIISWFKLTGHSLFDGIVSMNSSSEKAAYRIMVSPTNNPFYDAGSHNDQHFTNYTFKQNVWYHYVMTVKGDGDAILYINRKLVSTSPLGVPTILPNGKDIFIGTGEESSIHPAQAIIDDVRIYNRALSSQEIQQLYATTLETNISPKDSGTITKSPDKSSYSPNEEVTLTAKPAKGYKFKQWQGDASGSEATITIKMNGNQNVTAVFEEEEDEQPPIEISSKAIYDSKTKTLSLEGILVPYIDEFTGKETDNKGIFDAQLAEKTKLVFELIPWSINFKEMFEGEDTSGYILYHYETRSVDIPCFEVTTIAHIGDGIEGEAVYYKDVTMKQRHVDYPIFHVENMTETDSCN